MKIYSETDREPVTECELQLHSTNMCFLHICQPSHFEYPANLDAIGLIDRKNRAVIEFKDTREIDLLIQMLEQFKKENSKFFGYWEANK